MIGPKKYYQDIYEAQGWGEVEGTGEVISFFSLLKIQDMLSKINVSKNKLLCILLKFISKIDRISEKKVS